ncbi:MAG: antitoxin component YwqK of YwqJK toxin-antitoxin module [Psychroserpens sp.]|jgi:antitoxin component YwqK of YwqJK toxin-antitoxin module
MQYLVFIKQSYSDDIKKPFSKKLNMKPIVIIILLLWSFNISAQKKYQRDYFDDGTLASEGWISNNQKINYWKYYHANGQLKSEGHYKKNERTKYWRTYRNNRTKESEGHYANGNKNKWWLFYDSEEKINHKCQLKNNQKNGYCLMYRNEKLVSAVKYSKGKKIKEWTDYQSFRKENSLKDLK